VFSTLGALCRNGLDQIADLTAQVQLGGHGATVQMVGHLIPLKGDRPDLVRPHAAPDLGFPSSFAVAGKLCLAGFLESSTQKTHRRLPVDVLGTSPINTDLDGRGFVDQDHARVGLVPMLTTGATSTSKRLLDIFGVDDDLKLRGFLQNRNRDGRSLNSTTFFCRGYALPTMAARLMFKRIVGTFAADTKHEEPWPQVKDVMAKDTPARNNAHRCDTVLEPRVWRQRHPHHFGFPQ